ncbi:hypothetical protein Tco_0514884 [Tanacetum coccineum]
MDDLNITVEEYIRLEEERAQRHDFEAKFPAIILGNIIAVPSPSPEIPCYKSAQGTTMREYDAEKEDSEIEFPAIVLDNTSISDTAVSYEPTIHLPEPPVLLESNISYQFIWQDSKTYLRECCTGLHEIAMAD